MMPFCHSCQPVRGIFLGATHLDSMPSVARGTHLGADARWKVIHTLGEGQFAEVFEVEDTKTTPQRNRYALKLERRPETNSVLGEYKVLKRLKNLPAVPKVLELGEFSKRYFLVMDLLGRNLHVVRSSSPGGKLDAEKAMNVGRATLEALKGVHQAGYVHRDVKPANFVYDVKDADVWYVVDFGLARRYLDERGEVVSERIGAGFRGSSTYASVHAQQEKDQGRRDDLWSWLYMIVELLTGTLPWRVTKERSTRKDWGDKVLQRKMKCRENPEELMAPLALPIGLLKICKHLDSLEFGDSPNYEVIKHALNSLSGLGVSHLNEKLVRHHRSLVECRSQGTGSDGLTRASNSPTVCSIRHDTQRSLATQPDIENEEDANCLVGNKTPTPTSDMSPGCGYHFNVPDKPEAMASASGFYCASAQSTRTIVWENRSQDHVQAPCQQQIEENRQSGWVHQENFQSRQTWGVENCCGENLHRGHSPWQMHQWPSNGIGWSSSCNERQGNYPPEPCQNPGYSICHYGSEQGRPREPWNQTISQYSSYGNECEHKAFPQENMGDRRQHDPAGNSSHSWAKSTSNLPPENRACDASTRLNRPGLVHLPGSDMHTQHTHLLRSSTSSIVQEWGAEEPSNIRDGNVRVEDNLLLDKRSCSVHSGKDPCSIDHKRRRVDGSTVVVEESDAGIKFMQDCVEWVCSSEGPPRAASLLKEFSGMDPLEGVAYVGALCSMLGNGTPNSAVSSVLMNISVFARHLADKLDERSGPKE